MAIVKVTPEMTAKAIGETDWRAVDAQTDADIARNVAADPDAAPIMTDEIRVLHLRRLGSSS
jgi:putative transcriptional regulator